MGGTRAYRHRGGGGLGVEPVPIPSAKSAALPACGDAGGDERPAGFEVGDPGPAGGDAPLGYVPYLTADEVEADADGFHTVPAYYEPRKSDWFQNAFYPKTLTHLHPKTMRDGSGAVTIADAQIRVYTHCVEFVSEKQHFHRRSRPPVGRGVVSDWSARSRSRLLRFLSKVQTGMYDVPIFATLTYHENWEERGAETKIQKGPRAGEGTGKIGWKVDLDSFTKRLSRHCAGVQYVWRIELQERGAPHFHLIIFPPIGAPIDEKEIGVMWHEVVDPGNADHYRVNTNSRAVKKIEGLDSFRKVFGYVSKYVAKKDARKGSAEIEAKLGRRWGRSRGIAAAPVLTFDLNESAEVQLKRIARRMLKARNRLAAKGRRWYGRCLKVGFGAHVFESDDAESALTRAAFSMMWEGCGPPRSG